MTRLGVHEALVDGELVSGDVTVEDGIVTAVGVSPAGHGTAVPGFIDLQVNGFGGVDFLPTDVAGYREAAAVLLSTGVTSFQPTLVSSPPEVLLDAIDVAAKARDEIVPRIVGVHLEGPFISHTFRGAHDERHLLDPDIDLAARLCGSAAVTTMTIAPELPGGFELLDWLTGHGVTVWVGHTAADAGVAHDAFNRGARAVTHLHNAQRRFTSRDPGISAVAMTRADVVVGLIPDLVHLARETVLLAFLAARGRVMAVTDAIQAAPRSTGRFRLGDRVIEVSEDAARLPDGTLAGSVLSLDRALRNLVDIGVPWKDAVAAMTTVPARLLRRTDIGTLRPGARADVAVLNDANEITRTVVAGRVAWSAE